ncbi:MAG: Trm112 family protein [Gammaproteobacteria bacterium]
MSLDRAVLDILCCPLTHMPLEKLAPERLARLNDSIAAGAVKNESRQVLAEPLAGALMTRDGKLAYPVRDGIPVLLIDQGIALSQCESEQ